MKLSLIFALWEIGKLCIGAERMKKADAVLGCCMLLMEIPYTAWGVWLLFHDFFGAALLWALAIAAFSIYGISKDAYMRFHPINCAASAAVLLWIFARKA
jgi:hypothetical protein